MDSDIVGLTDARRFELLSARFEGKEAIYVEKGVLRVRVSRIRLRLERLVSAEIEEVPTLGLGVGLFPDSRQRNGQDPLRWRIQTNDLKSFSEDRWHMGYGGWTLYFDPAIIQGVVDLASRLPESLDTWERYNEILRNGVYGKYAV